MAYSSEAAIDFWYEFDQAFLFARAAEVDALIAGIYAPSFNLDALVDDVRDNIDDLPRLVAGREEGFRRLAELQLAVMDRHFPDPADLQRAFMDFGQGVLYDEKKLAPGGQRRRPQGRLIHMMDGTPDDCVGYHRWHAFIRCAVASGADSARWLEVNRMVALAWAIYSRLNPHIDSPINAPLAPLQMAALRRDWLSADEATLNAAFLHYSGTFGSNGDTRRTKEFEEIQYFHVQSILAGAASDSNPQHTGARRFWELPMAEFLKTNVYGHNLIAPPGAGRGASSALTMVLRGTLPGIPRMPLNRPPLSPANIAYIERWIDGFDAAPT